MHNIKIIGNIITIIVDENFLKPIFCISQYWVLGLDCEYAETLVVFKRDIFDPSGPWSTNCV
jgi:hypothetical protein